MKLRLALLLTSLCIFSAQAEYDLNLSGQLRSYPSLGGSLDAEGGHSKLLWGATGGPMFGMIRSSLALSTSAVVHDWDTRVTVYPISFIGLGFGHKELTSNYDGFSDYDCDKVRCKGTLKRDYALAKMALGFGNFLATYQYLESRNSYSYKNSEKFMPVAEYGFVTLASPRNDEHTQQTYFIGYKLGDDLIGAVSNNIHFREADQDYAMNLLIYKTKLKQFGTTYGLGSFHTSYQSPGVIAIFKINYEVKPNMALF